MESQEGHGMIPPGKYIHRSTGQTIYVRDCFQDGDKLVIMSDKGTLDMKQFSEYFQVEEGEEMYVPNLQDLYGDKKPKKQLLAMINQGIDPEDRIKMNENSLETKNSQEQERNNQEEKEEKKSPKNKNYDLIKKVFDKFPVERTINFEIVEEEWPFKEFNMLVNVLDVPLKDICDYVIDNFLDKDHLSESLSKYFEEHMI